MKEFSDGKWVGLWCMGGEGEWWEVKEIMGEGGKLEEEGEEGVGGEGEEWVLKVVLVIGGVDGMWLGS